MRAALGVNRRLHPDMQRESSLHRSLKDLYAREGSQVEAVVEGYQVDVVLKEELVEIQTGSFGALKRKIVALTRKHSLRVVHPIAVRRRIVRISPEDGSVLTERLSPKHGKWADVFLHLVYLSGVIPRARFCLEVLLTEENDHRIADGKGSWRRRGVSLVDRTLVTLIDRRVLRDTTDYLNLLGVIPSSPFTSRDLAEANRYPLRLAQRALYFLSRCQAVEIISRSRYGYQYLVSPVVKGQVCRKKSA